MQKGSSRARYWRRVETSAGAGALAGVDEGDAPGLGDDLMNVHPVVVHVEGDVGGVEEVVGEELLDDVALVAEADDEVGDAVLGVDLEDVPEDGPAADLDHGLGAESGLLRDASAEAAGEDDCFHVGVGDPCVDGWVRLCFPSILSLSPRAYRKIEMYSLSVVRGLVTETNATIHNSRSGNLENDLNDLPQRKMVERGLWIYALLVACLTAVAWSVYMGFHRPALKRPLFLREDRLGICNKLCGQDGPLGGWCCGTWTGPAYVYLSRSSGVRICIFFARFST